MSSAALITQILNGLTIGMVLILIAAGLTLIFGMMEVVNFAHGSLYMLGAYLGLSLVAWTGNFWIALLVAPPLVGIVGFLIERFNIRPLYGRGPLYHLLLTFGVGLVIREVVYVLWGPSVHSIAPPAILSGVLKLGEISYPIYRLFVLFFSASMVVMIWLLLRRSNFGLIIRAGTYDREMVDALGIDVSRIFTMVFVFGSVLAAVAGVVVAPMRSVHPEMGIEVIIDAFIAVIIGGMGSFPGAVVGALALGLAEVLGILFIPSFAKAAIYIVVVIILLTRPAGLFGEEMG